MGRRQREAAEVKRRLVVELDAARRAITHEIGLAQVQFNPASMARRSMERHRWAWVAGGAFAGVILIRLLLPPKFRSDNSGETVRKRGFFALAAGLAFTLVRRAVTSYAAHHLQEHAQNYIDSTLNRRDPVRTDHVAN